MSDFESVVERYLATWNETNPDRRQALLGKVFTEDVLYTDPLAETEGHAALNGLIGAVQAQFPGFVFSPGGPVDAHHQQGRFTWRLGPAGEEPVVVGFDVAHLAPDGRIRMVLGFIDQAPAGIV